MGLIGSDDEFAQTSPPTMRHASITSALLVALLACDASAQCLPQWSALDTGVGNSGCRALLLLPNGDVVVGGDFATAGGVSVSNIARWDGTDWTAMGTGLNGGAVAALALLPNGDVVAGGSFTQAGMAFIARWDGTAWQPLGTGLNDIVRALTVLPNGDVIAGGDFSSAGGVSASNIARWDGTNWSSIGGGTSSRVFGLTTLSNGDVVAAGQFTVAGGVSAYRVARWNGFSWSAMGLGLAGNVFDFEQLSNGDLIAVGGFGYIGPPGGTQARGMALWDGLSWSPIGTLLLSPGVFGSGASVDTLPNGDVIVGGFFNSVDGVTASNIVKLDGSSWSPLGAGTGNLVTALAVAPNGDVFAGGTFTTAGGLPVNYVARWGGCAVAGVPRNYCTAGTTTNGCNALLSGSGTPSASAPNGFTIDVAGSAGQRNGLVFYGVSGRNASPWGMGAMASSSWLCVKAPTQRTPPGTTTGTAGLCDGTFSIDWNAYTTGNPSALGAPFSAGNTVNAQFWYRDPPSPNTTHLSDGLEFVVCP